MNLCRQFCDVLQSKFFFACARVCAYGVSTVIFAVVVSFSATAKASSMSYEQAITALKGSDLKQKYTALQTLQAAGRAEAADALAAQIVREKDVNFQLAALDLVAGLGAVRAVSTLSSLLQSPIDAVRQRAARVIGILGGKPAEKALLKALKGEANGNVRSALLQGLSLCGSSESVDAIEAQLSDARPDIRANAVNALGRIPGERSKLALQKAQTDKDSNVRKLAGETIKSRTKTK
jgi:HEAT repeat protein